jgi:hypothetical protein
MMSARRNQAKLTVRISALSNAIDQDDLPAWAFGLQAMPDYLNPVPPQVVTAIQDNAKDLANLCLGSLRIRCAEETHKADTLLNTTRDFYTHAGADSFQMAETRLGAMAMQARNRERESQTRQRANNYLHVPQSDAEWQTTLPRRRVTRILSGNVRSASGSRDSRDSSRERATGSRPQPPPSPPPQGGAAAKAARNRPGPSKGKGRAANQNPRGGNTRKRPAQQSPNRGGNRRKPPQLSEDEMRMITALRAYKIPKRK